MDYSVFIPILVAVVAPVGTYLLAARRMSGKIQTSDAAQLWTEARDIRNDYRERLVKAGERQSALEQRMANLESKNNELMNENIRLRHEITECTALVASLRLTISALKKTIESQDKELKE